jgi:hypothetical protein
MKLVLAAVLLAPVAAPTTAPPAASPTATRQAVDVIRLRTASIDAGALGRELALRLPSAKIVSHDADVAAAPGFTVFVDIRPDPAPTRPDAWSLTLVASDGRAYDRRVTADASSSRDDVVRLIASNVGNLVAAIEAGTVQHDRQDVPIPPPALAASPCPTCPPPKPPAPCPPPSQPTPPPAAAPAALDIGIGVAPMVAIGLGDPADADRFTAAGGDVALWLRHRTGVLVGADVRMLGRRLAFDTSILRTRIGLALGYAWRRNSFELATTAALTVEPWSVRASGSRSMLGDPEGAARTGAPLLGGALRIVPAHRFEIGGIAVRLGPRLEVAASSAIGDGGRVAQLLVDAGGDLTTVGRIGGWEIGIGIDAVVWIPVRAKRRARTRADRV